MNIPTAAIQKPKVGTCPHGLPLGACPICNGMGGGGGGAAKTSPKKSNAGEMTWDQCFAIWQQMLKTENLAQQKQELAMQARLNTPLDAQTRLANLAQNIANLTQKLTQFSQKGAIESMPKIIAKPLALLAKVAIPILDVIKNTVVLVQKAVAFIQTKLADISDKLNAMFGELKNSIEKKISDRLKNFKKKVKSLFGIFEPLETDDEDKKIEESKRLFELKTLLQSVKEKIFKNKKELKDADSHTD